MYETILKKLQKQISYQQPPTLAFLDFDGTVFTGKPQLWSKDRYYNKKTADIFKTNNIPFIIVTGRTHWGTIAQYILKFFNLPKPDAIITGAGTQIHYRLLNNKEEKDGTYQTFLEKTSHTWDKKQILSQTTKCKDIKSITLKKEDANKFLIRYNAKNLPVQTLENIKNELGKNNKGSSIIVAEKLFVPNSPTLYNGDILITPNNAGKENAITYLLDTIAASPIIKKGNLPLQAYVFGDSSIDIGMLTLPNTPTYRLHQYGVNLTPLAKQALIRPQKNHPNLTITSQQGSKEIYKTYSEILQK